MHITSFVLTAVLSLFPLLSSAEHHRPARRHTSVAHRRRPDSVPLHKRESGRATFYEVGLGACGQWNNPGDFIVALNSAEFGGGFPGPNCFKSITISYNGKTTQATIMDECPGCPPGGLDMSEGLFKYFADESVGVFYMDWWYNDGSPEPAPTTTHKHKPKPTPTWVDPFPWTSDYTSSETKTESYSSSSSSSSTSSSSSSSVVYNSTSSIASSTSSVYAANPTGAPVSVNVVSTIAGVNQLVIALAQLVKG